MARQCVAVVIGGRSSEHEVSLLSGQSIVRALLPDYEVIVLGIRRDGCWIQVTPEWLLSQEADVRTIALPNSAPSVIVQPVPGRLFSHEDGRLIAVDVVLPITHGTFGEDGTLQGLLQLAQVPFVGPDVRSAVNAIDKTQMRQLFSAQGLPQVPYLAFTRRDIEDNVDKLVGQIAEELALPVFVKAASLGSSVGVYRVDRVEELALALQNAARYDMHILVECGLVGMREIEVAVLGNHSPEASLPGEIHLSRSFYDYEDKYVLGSARTQVPATLPAPWIANLQALSIRAFKALRCQGMARVDFLVNPETGEANIIEVNTLPGFTAISMYPKLWQASGRDFAQLLTDLITLAFDSHAERACNLLVPEEEIRVE